MGESDLARVIATGAPESIVQAAEVLEDGGLIAFPTDTVYGLGAMLSMPSAISRLFQVKSRPADRPIPVLMADAGALAQLGAKLAPDESVLANTFWPGPLTMVVSADRALARRLGSRESVGVRVPDHPFALELLAHVGPLAVTSANLSGQPNARTADQVRDQLGRMIELILDGGASPGPRPSTVIRSRDGQIEILREGPISLERLQTVLAKD